MCNALGESDTGSDGKRHANANEESAMNCPQCGKPIEKPVSKKIIYQTRDPGARRNRVAEKTMEFCSDTCGSHYQMGCEG